MMCRYAWDKTPEHEYKLLTTNPLTELENIMYNFTITQGKKTILQFTDKTAIKAHAIVTTANELAKYKSQHLSYTYKYAK